MAHPHALAAPDLPAYPEQPELAVAALLYMLSRYPAVRCPAMARAIAAHLACVAQDARLPEAYRATAERLLPEWQGQCAFDEAPGALRH